MKDNEYTYNLVEYFNSIQGEGYNFGMECTFIRLSDCNLNCYWCDTDWKKTNYIYTLNDIGKNILQNTTSKNIIITGGEPTKDIKKLDALVSFLQSKNYKVYIESNGLFPLRDWSRFYENVWITFSPKLIYWPIYKQKLDEQKLNTSEFKYQNGFKFRANEIRIVIDPKLKIERQIDIITEIFNVVPKDTLLYLSPCEVNGKFELDKLAKIYDTIKHTFKQIRISIQLHKIMGVE